MTSDDCVLDTSALIAVIRGEPGAERVRDRLTSGRRFMHAVNVAEFLFTAPRRRPDRFTPESALAWLNAAEIGVVDILDLDFLQLTAHIRLAERSLSVGDGVSVALASVLDIPLVTAERSFKHAREYARIELIR